MFSVRIRQLSARLEFYDGTHLKVLSMDAIITKMPGVENAS